MSYRGRGAPPRGPRGGHGVDHRAHGHGRSREHSPGGHTSRHGKHPINGADSAKGGLVDIAVGGWRNSKAADGIDGGIGKLREFLERKASPPNAAPVKITKSRREGDVYIISIRPELVKRILHLNGFSFAGAPLTIERWTPDSTEPMVTSPFDPPPAGQPHGSNGFGRYLHTAPAQAGGDTKAFLKQVLAKRYDPNLKLLNLSALKADPDLQQLGVFANPATESKFFPVLMKICDEVWDTPAKQAEAVESVMVNDNQLASVIDITTLAATFPSLKNLDLSNNIISDFEGFKYWRWKFRNLEHLVITNNAIGSLPDFQKTILKWYPKLLRLNGNQVRTPGDVQKQHNPIPAMSPYFQDEADICAKFVTDFFPLFDTDRTTALRHFYDASSSFSVSINTQAKRVRHEERHSSTWDQYMKKSRNLLKITHLPARVSRLYRGSEIQATWEQFPRTKHPTLNHQPSEWLIECHPLPGLPDPQNRSSSGVGGLIIMVHGNFEEIHPQTGKTTDQRSFDRTFVIGPGGGIGGVRVVSDLLVLRSWGGSDAWNLNLNNKNNDTATTNNNPLMPNIQASPATAVLIQSHPEIPPGSSIGQAAPGKPDMQVQQEIRAIDLSFKTRMKLEWAAKCLMENGWDLDKAYVNFQALVASNSGAIPAEAFLDVKR